MFRESVDNRRRPCPRRDLDQGTTGGDRGLKNAGKTDGKGVAPAGAVAVIGVVRGPPIRRGQQHLGDVVLPQLGRVPENCRPPISSSSLSSAGQLKGLPACSRITAASGGPCPRKDPPWFPPESKPTTVTSTRKNPLRSGVPSATSTWSSTPPTGQRSRGLPPPPPFEEALDRHPLRPAEGSGGPGARSAAAVASSFRDFDESVSDAWEIRDDEKGGGHPVVIDVQPTPSVPAAFAGLGPDLARALPRFHGGDGQLKLVAKVAELTPAAAGANPAHERPDSGPKPPRQARAGARNGSSSFNNNNSSNVNNNIVNNNANNNHHGGTSQESKRFAKMACLLKNGATFELEELRKLAWSGTSTRSRSKAWKILCGYLPPPIPGGSRSARRNQDEVVQRKRDEYFRYVKQYFPTRHEDAHSDTYRQIHIDIPRMSPVLGLFQQRCVQEIFERVLYIWAIRHPASGYVQGINDLVTPFFLVFLHDCLNRRRRGRRIRPAKTNVEDDDKAAAVAAGEVEEDEDDEDDDQAEDEDDDEDDMGADAVKFQAVLTAGDSLDVEKALPADERDLIEADSFWCLTKVLDGIQDNYTFAQPGIQRKVRQLEDLTRRIDRQLHDHLVGHDVAYLQFSFRWMNNLLMRELPIKATIRLWDTYLAQADGFSHFHLYVCAAFLIHWKSELLKKTDFHTILMFLQNVPTAKWGDNEISLIVAEAYRLSFLFADAPSHLAAGVAPAAEAPFSKAFS